MLLALRVREVRALVRVQRQAETTFERAEMVAEDVWVLGAQREVRDEAWRMGGDATCLGEVDGLEREFSETLSAVDIALRRTRDTTTAEFRANSILCEK